MLAQDTFVAHPCLLHDAPGGGVAGKVLGEDAIELELDEGVPNNRPSTLRTIATAPIALADEISQLAARVLRAEPQAHVADHLARFTKGECQRHGYAALEVGSMFRNPLLGIRERVRSRKRQRGGCQIGI